MVWEGWWCGAPPYKAGEGVGRWSGVKERRGEEAWLPEPEREAERGGGGKEGKRERAVREGGETARLAFVRRRWQGSASFRLAFRPPHVGEGGERENSRYTYVLPPTVPFAFTFFSSPHPPLAMLICRRCHLPPIRAVYHVIVSAMCVSCPCTALLIYAKIKS
jgi:hypothetical protein